MIRTMIFAAIATGALSGCGVFDEHGHDRRTAMLESRVSLVEAITTAEKETGGKAIRAGADEEGGVVLIKVSIIQNNSLQRVFIDTQTGKIVKTRSDEGGD